MTLAAFRQGQTGGDTVEGCARYLFFGGGRGGAGAGLSVTQMENPQTGERLKRLLSWVEEAEVRQTERTLRSTHTLRQGSAVRSTQRRRMIL